VHIGPSANAANEAQRAYLGRTARDTGAGTGAIDHIAFRATGLHAMLEHLRAQGVPLKQRRANGQALFQLFSFDPTASRSSSTIPPRKRMASPASTNQRGQCGLSLNERVGNDESTKARRQDGLRTHQRKDCRVG